jgi:hypothetical protein
VRLHIAETPEFEAIRELRTELPIVDLLRTHSMATLLAHRRTTGGDRVRQHD